MDEKLNTTYSSPSIIQRNTPIRRLGLSRKRKSSCPEISVNKLQSSNSFKSPLNRSDTSCHVEFEDVKGQESDEAEDSENVNNICDSDTGETLKKKLKKAEQSLLVESVNCGDIDSEVKELEGLCEIWKNGCKEALFHLLELLKEKQPEFNSVEKVSVKLGIWDIIQSTFKDEPDFLAYED